MKSSIVRRVSGVVLGTLALLDGSSCGGSKKPIVVGSKNTTAGALIGEITAQHLEQRLGRKVQRNLSLGNTELVYQSLMNGQIGIYPEETGTIQTVILKEEPSLDAATALERGRLEMKRLAQVEVMQPLGVDNSWAVVVRKSDAGDIKTLTEARDYKPGWKLGDTHDFNERSDGLAVLTLYRLPMSAMTRVSDPGTLYAALEKGELTMVVGNVTDGPVNRHSDWMTLKDDKKAFPFYQTCLMVRDDLVANDPKIRTALVELTGKFNNDQMAKLDAEVDVDHKKLADVAKEFLAQVGLK